MLIAFGITCRRDVEEFWIHVPESIHLTEHSEVIIVGALKSAILIQMWNVLVRT